jgi:threonine synthase
MIALATASPAKFPSAVKSATGIHPELPAHMSDLFDRDEKMDLLENNLEQVRSHIIAILEDKS